MINKQNLKLINRRCSNKKIYKFNQIILIPYQKYLNKQPNNITIQKWLKYFPNPHTLTTISLIRDHTPRELASYRTKRENLEFQRSQAHHQLTTNQNVSWNKFNQITWTTSKLWNLRLHHRSQMLHHQEARLVYLQVACFHLELSMLKKKMK